jgi:hypothetical protein
MKKLPRNIPFVIKMPNPTDRWRQAKIRRDVLRDFTAIN